MIHKISTKGMSRDEWLQLRQKTIGGSDAAAIIGLSKWETSYSVWAEKTGRIAHTEDNEANCSIYTRSTDTSAGETPAILDA